MRKCRRNNMLNNIFGMTLMAFLTVVGMGLIVAFPVGIAHAVSDGSIVYNNDTTTPQNRAYTGSTNSFSAASATLANATPAFIVNKYSPTRDERIVGYVGTNNTLYIMRWNGTVWSNEWNVAVGASTNGRRFDIAYENITGNAIVVYSRNAATQELVYRVWNGSTWTGATNIESAWVNAVVNWVKMASMPGSNQIAVTFSGTDRSLSTFIWSGAAWGNEPGSAHTNNLSRNTTSGDYDTFDLAYESSSGDLMVVWGDSTSTDPRYRTYSGGTWSGTAEVTNQGDLPAHLDLASDPLSNRIILGYNVHADTRFYGSVWNGSSWSAARRLDSDTGQTSRIPTANRKEITVAFLNSGATRVGIVAFNNNTTSGRVDIAYTTNDGGSFAWNSFVPSPVPNRQAWIDIQVDPVSNDTMMLTFSDNNLDLFAKRLVINSTPTFTWTNSDGGSALFNNLTDLNSQNFSFAWSACIDPDPSTITIPASQTAYGDPYNVSGMFTTTGDVGSFEYKVIKPNSATITNPQAWTNLNNDTTPEGTFSYTVNTGNIERLLVVAISTGRGTAGTETATVTYGGVNMTEAIGDGGTSLREHTHIFYLKDTPSVMDGTAKNLVVTISGTLAYGHVYAGVYANVDQTSPISDSKNFNSGATAQTAVGPFNPALNIGTNEIAAEIVFLMRTSSTTSRTIQTWATYWSSGLNNFGDDNTNGYRAYIASDSTAGTTTSQHTASDTTLSSMSAVTLKPGALVCTNWTSNASIPATTASGSLCGDYTNGGTYTLDVRGTDPDCATSVTTMPKNFTWNACNDTDLATLTITAPTSGSTVSGIYTIQVQVGVESAPSTMNNMAVTVAGSSACNVTSQAMSWNSGTSRWEYNWNTSACGDPAENGITINVSGNDPDCGNTVNAPQVTNITVDNEGPKTTVGDGTDPSNASLCPGDGATMLDAFTLQTNTGTDTVTAVQVDFAAGTTAGIGLVEINSDDGGTVYGSQSNPADPQNITLSTSINVTTSSVQYKVRITPKSHAAMPAPPGASYSVTGTVTQITSSLNKSYNDADSATVTIDNASPSNATWGTITTGQQQVTLNWTNPAVGDFNKVLILRKTSSISDAPEEGTIYAASGIIGTSTVVYVGNGTTFTDTGLTNGTNYYYKVFAYDNCINYATGAQIGPITPPGSPYLTYPASPYDDGINPDTGDTTTDFTFKVIYTDAENDPPAAGYPKIYIGDNDGYASYTMSLDTSAAASLKDGNYTNGEQYVYGPIGLGAASDLRFYFEAQASTGCTDIVRLPSDAPASFSTGPDVYLLDGYNMVGVPKNLGTGLLYASVLGDDSGYPYCITWESTGLDTGATFNGLWIDCTYDTVTTGRGYYIWSTDSNYWMIDEPSGVGNVTTTYFDIDLDPNGGWTMISNPYNIIIQLQNIKVVRSSTEYTFSQAVTNGWIDNSIYEYEGSVTGYAFSAYNGSPPATLKPWVGYFIYLKGATPTQMRIYAP